MPTGTYNMITMNRFKEWLTETGEQQGPYRTPIAYDAYNVLRSWGVSRGLIQDLQEATGKYRDQYGRCEEKIAGITQGFIAQNELGWETFLLPRFYRGMNVPFSGDCLVLANQLQADLHLFGYKRGLEAANRTRNIEIGFIQGQSRQFFNRQGARHFWLGMQKVGEVDTVAIDPSFQEITLMGSNGYHTQKELNSYPGSQRLLVISAPVFNLKSASVTRGLVHESYWRSFVIGMSQDGTRIMQVGANRIDKQIVPFIKALGADGRQTDVMVQHGGQFSHLAYNSSAVTPELTSRTNEEMRKMLKIAQQISFKTVQPAEREKLEGMEYTFLLEQPSSCELEQIDFEESADSPFK